MTHHQLDDYKKMQSLLDEDHRMHDDQHEDDIDHDDAVLIEEDGEEDPLLEPYHYHPLAPRTNAVSPTTIVWTRHQCNDVPTLPFHQPGDHKTKANCNTNNFQLPEDLLAYTACFLNVGSLKQARLVNRQWNRVLSTDKAGWQQHVLRLATRRLHVAQVPPAMTCLSAKDTYRMACADARLRHAVRRQELIYDYHDHAAAAAAGGGGGTIWSFRFKQVAGMEWTQQDPWHQGSQARQMVFLANGTVRQFNGKTRTLHAPFYDAPRLRGGLDITWRFVRQPIDLPKKECGAYVRLTIAGRDVPTYMVHRSPSGNWGFLMENCWGLFSSFELPPKKTATVNPQAQALAARTTVPRMRLRRDSLGGARWLDVSQEESDDDDFDPTHQDLLRRDKNYLLEDASLHVTCRWQWREALLYNLGASILPDGPNATADFDRAWQLSMRSMQSFGFPTNTNAANARNNINHHHEGQEDDDDELMDDL